eukprot:GHUV01015837.1.p1 GENE.GHUV01015837.1~~GHUV01015837.1.p1  ORF type:complete len:282 (+),score=35.19 GHUV01015837.1:152-997(+)
MALAQHRPTSARTLGVRSYSRPCSHVVCPMGRRRLRLATSTTVSQVLTTNSPALLVADPIATSPDKASHAATQAYINGSDKPFKWLQYWYPVHALDQIDPSKPHAVELLGKQLVLWCDGQGDWQAMEDACPHRCACILNWLNDFHPHATCCSTEHCSAGNNCHNLAWKFGCDIITLAGSSRRHVWSVLWATISCATSPGHKGTMHHLVLGHTAHSRIFLKGSEGTKQPGSTESALRGYLLKTASERPTVQPPGCGSSYNTSLTYLSLGRYHSAQHCMKQLS